MGRPREHDETTGAALLDAAEALLADGGPDAVTVRGVARAVGVPTRAVYSLFASKEGLIQHLAAHGYQLLADRVNGLSATDDPAADLVNAGVHGFRYFALTRPHLFRLTFERVSTDVAGNPQASEAALASYHALVGWIRRAQQAGAIDDRPEEEVAFAFHSCCQGLAGGELSREPPPIGSNFWRPVHGIDGEKLWNGTLTALVAGLAPYSQRRSHQGSADSG